MDTLLCHSGMLLGSIVGLAFFGTTIGGLGLLAASVLRRASRQTASG